MRISLTIIILLTLSSCDGQIEDQNSQPPLSLCEQALAHIQKCKGYRPRLVRCTEEIANRILETQCDDIDSLWE